MQNIKLNFLRYWLAMNATAMQSAVHALRAYCGLAGVSVATQQIAPLTWQQGMVVFLFAFGAAILNYLDANPLEKLFPSETSRAVASAKADPQS